MPKSILMLAVISLMIAACGAQPTTPAPQEGYPAPQETEPIEQPETQVDSGDSVYPPPFPTATPLTDFGTVYPVPEDGIQTFRIVPGESQLAYEVGEVFLNQDNAFNVAVGITPEVSGDIMVDQNNPQNSSLGVITADISQFTSDNQRRDNAIRERFLGSAQFPTVEFSPQEIQGLPTNYQEGQEINFQVVGNVTIRDVTLPATFDVTMIGNGDTITGEATTTILMSDFGFGPISIAGILNTEDEVNVKFTFVARP